MTSNKGFGQIIRNIAWHSSEKVLRMLIGFGVGIWVARYLGPEKFGNFNYIMAWLGMFGAVAWLGVGDTVMRDLVRDRTDEGKILGSAFMIRLCGSLLAVVLAFLSAKWFGHFTESQLMMLGILSIGLPFAEAPAGIWLWFASHTNIRPAVLGKNISMILGGLLKIAVILLDLGLIFMLGAVAIESVLLGICLVSAYLLSGERINAWRFDFRHAWPMLITGIPIVLSGLVASLNAQVDQIMLGRLAGMHDVGVYAAAMRFSEIWWVVPPMIIQTLAARYIYPKDLGDQLRTNMARIILGMTVVAFIPCLVFFVIGTDVISLILGKQYFGASSVLMIHIWTAVPIFIDAPINQYLLATNRQAQLIVKAGILLTLNLGMALLLVPQFTSQGIISNSIMMISEFLRLQFGNDVAYARELLAYFASIQLFPRGAQGAATATLIAHVCTILLLPLFYRPLSDLRSIYRRSFKELFLLIGIGFSLIMRKLSKS